MATAGASGTTPKVGVGGGAIGPDDLGRAVGDEAAEVEDVDVVADAEHESNAGNSVRASQAA